MGFEVRRGTNISHWLSQSRARGQDRRGWFVEDDVKRLADWGFDHLRLPIDEEQMWTEDGTREMEAFELLDSALDWADRAGLRVIVDLHILRGHYFNAAGEPALFSDPAVLEKFVALWRDLAAFLKARPTGMVAYEILNEAVARDPQDWNRVAAHLFQTLRDLEPARTIVLGSNRWNQAATFPDLAVPDDDHLLLTFHYYRPMLITHHTAKWTDAGNYTGPIQYPGHPVPDNHLDALAALYDDAEERNQFFDRDVLMQEIKVPWEVAQQTNHPLYCGEFGVYRAAPLEIQLRWLRDIISVFDELGIGWANWDYKGGFGLVERDGKAETGIRAALLG